MMYASPNVYKWILTYLRFKVRRRYLAYISYGQPICYTLIQDGSKNHESACYILGK